MRAGRNSWIIVALAVAVALASIWFGFQIDAKSFAVNALSGLASMLLSILLAVLVVDRVLDSSRRRRWALVSAETTETLRLALIRSGRAFFLLLPLPRPPLADVYMLSLADSDQLASGFRQLADLIAGLPDAALIDAGAPFPTSVIVEMQLIRQAVMPPLLSLGDPDLVAAVAAIEGRYQALQHGVFISERFGGEHIAMAAAALLSAMADAVKVAAAAS